MMYYVLFWNYIQFKKEKVLYLNITALEHLLAVINIYLFILSIDQLIFCNNYA